MACAVTRFCCWALASSQLGSWWISTRKPRPSRISCTCKWRASGGPATHVRSATHDFTEKRWRHLNPCQHHCDITASVPRVKSPKHGVHLVEVPWGPKGSAFNLLFEQAALALVREMPVLAAARLMGITDTRLWRITQFLNYAQALVRRHAAPGAGAQGPRDAKDPCATPGARLDLVLHQRPPGGLHRAVPGRSCQSSWIPQHRHLHHHELPDRQPRQLHPQIHVKRRRTRNLNPMRSSSYLMWWKS